MIAFASCVLCILRTSRVVVVVVVAVVVVVLVVAGVVVVVVVVLAAVGVVIVRVVGVVVVVGDEVAAGAVAVAVAVAVVVVVVVVLFCLAFFDVSTGCMNWFGWQNSQEHVCSEDQQRLLTQLHECIMCVCCLWPKTSHQR